MKKLGAFTFRADRQSGKSTGWALKGKLDGTITGS